MLCLVWGVVFGERSTCFKPLNRSLFLFLHKRRTHFLSKTNTLPNIQRSISGRGSHTFFFEFFFRFFQNESAFYPDNHKWKYVQSKVFFSLPKGFQRYFYAEDEKLIFHLKICSPGPPLDFYTGNEHGNQILRWKIHFSSSA